ncbi:hypothetical protein NFI96_010106 [Prochilodus magdalenae]|nr:hypothetical protein NFI96_010106 [Prochilodus magdalenae]
MSEHSPNICEDQTLQKANTLDHEAIQESSEDKAADFPVKETTEQPLLLEKDEISSVPSVEKEWIMSLDISEYELQILERQAREEEKEEQSILAFQEKAALENSADLSYDADSDEEFDSQMVQCAEEIEKLNESFEKQPDEPQPEDEDEDVEEDKEEGFGYGKSLCFQFPPVYCMNISVVISPLIALMEDQVLQLTMSNIPACYLGSAQTQNLFADLKNGVFRVVYMTPEFCSGNIALLELLNRSIGLSLIAVDEAHCISQWGHDFRGAYRDLGKLKKSLPDVPIVALTATASPSIRNDIVRSLHLVNPLVTCTSFDRPNLYLDVNRKSGDITRDLKRFLLKKAGGEYEFEGAAIVYCPSKKEAERVKDILYSLGIRCGVYHAGLGIKQRKETQYQFMRDEIQCVVATVAFGMGINKPDIRKVIHYGAPKEMESYYQEIGRAGRDGLPSACHVLWAPADMVLNRFILRKTVNDRFRGYKLEMMAKMQKYLNSTKCRRKTMFNTSEDSLKQDLQDFGPRAFQLMGAVSAMGEKFGITAPLLFLRGSTSQKVPDRFRNHPLFGAGRTVSEAWWKALSRELMAENYLMETSGHSRFSTLCKLTPQGRTWLNKAQDERHRTLLLQPNRDLCVRVQVPRSQETRPPVARAQDGFPPGTTQRVRSNGDASEVVKKAEVLDIRFVPGPSQTPTAKPQPPAVSAREMELQAELYGKLVAERQKLASVKDVPPAILATNKILLDMAKLRPCTVARLMQVDGVSEAKAKMLAPLLQTVTEFCQRHNLQEAVATCSAAPCHVGSMQAVRPLAVPLTDSVALSYRLFQSEGKSLRQVADARSLPVAVVESHLLQAQKANCPLDTERAGLSASVFNTITRIVASPPLSSDLSDFKSIRTLVPEEISTFQLRLGVTKLQKEGIPSSLPNSSSAQHSIAWIEPQAKPNEVQPKRVEVDGAKAPFTTAPQPQQPKPEPELDSMDMSEDEFFIELDMPEEDLGPNDSGAQPSAEAVRPSTTVSYTDGMMLASWNQESLDKDTQDLFSISPVKAAPPTLGAGRVD